MLRSIAFGARGRCVRSMSDGGSGLRSSGVFGDPAPSTDRPVAYEAYLKGIGAERTMGDRLAQYWKMAPVLIEGAVVTLKLASHR